MTLFTFIVVRRMELKRFAYRDRLAAEMLLRHLERIGWHCVSRYESDKDGTPIYPTQVALGERHEVAVWKRLYDNDTLDRLTGHYPADAEPVNQNET